MRLIATTIFSRCIFFTEENHNRRTGEAEVVFNLDQVWVLQRADVVWA